jgi:hypothetical protein
MEPRSSEYLPENFFQQDEFEAKSWFLNSFLYENCTEKDQIFHIKSALNNLNDE